VTSIDRAVLLAVAGVLLVLPSCSADDLTASGGTSTTSSGDATGGTGATGSGGAGAMGGGSGTAGGSCAAGAACVPSPPSGWDGPFSVLVSASGSGVRCGSGYELVVQYDTGDVDGTVTCAPCACGAMTGAQCADLQVMAYGSTTTCGGTASTLTFGAQACMSVGIASPYAHSVKASAPTVSGQASCPASGGEPTKSTVTWTEQVVVCGPSAAPACANGVCMPPPPQGFPDVACVTHVGSVACPDGYPMKSTAYGGVEDTRDCTLCACLPPSVACSADVKAFLGAGCTSTATSVTPDGTACPAIPIGNPGWQSVQVVQTLGGGGCDSAGGMPTGSVTPANDVTVCCAG